MPDPESQMCAVCREEIKAGAKKCVRCGSYQTFIWRFQVLGHVTLVLLLALLSVLTTAVPIITTTLTPKRDDIRVRLMSVDHKAQHVNLFVSNLGSRAGAIGSVWVSVPPALAVATTTPGWHLDLPADASIRPGESRHLALSSSEHALPEAARHYDLGHEWSLTVSVIRFDGTTREIELPVRALDRP